MKNPDGNWSHPTWKISHRCSQCYFQTELKKIDYKEKKWILTFSDGNKKIYEKLILTCPFAQLRKLSKKPVKFIEEYNFSCPIGIQGIIKEKNRKGYCIIYSYFWLYVILHCFKSIPNVDLETLISKVETQILKSEKIDTIIYNIPNRLYKLYNK